MCATWLGKMDRVWLGCISDLQFIQKEQMEGRWIRSVKAPFSIHGDAQVSTAVTVHNLLQIQVSVCYLENGPPA